MRHQARLLGVILVLSLLLIPAFGETREGEALRKAQQHILEQLGLKANAYRLLREHHDQKHGYRTYFFELHEPGDSDGQIFLQLNPQGQVSDFQAPRPSWLEPLTQALKDSERELPYGSSAVDIVALQQRFLPDLPRIGQLLAAQQPEAIRMGRPYAFGSMLMQPLMVPPAGALAEEQALRLAGEAVCSLPLWDQETLAMYPHYFTACFQSEAHQRPLYLVVFRQRPIPAESEIEHYMRSYVGKLDAHFGGQEFAAPRHVSVLLDAMSGEVVEAPLEMRSGPGYRTPYQLFR